MSLKKAIEHGKEHRKSYRGSKAFSRSCRCHGGCPYCYGNRMHADAKKKAAQKERLKIAICDFSQ